MPQTSAGLLPFTVDAAGVRLFIVRMAGPFFVGKDFGAWTIAKGLYDPASESPVDAARREFAEEVGVPAPEGELIDLGQVRASSGKLITVFAVDTDPSLAFVGSNLFELEWPRGSGSMQWFPEVDDGQWFAPDVARRKLAGVMSQFVDRLVDAVAR